VSTLRERYPNEPVTSEWINWISDYVLTQVPETIDLPTGVRVPEESVLLNQGSMFFFIDGREAACLSEPAPKFAARTRL